MISGINHITLAVKDIDTAFSFYREILGLTPVARWDQSVYFMAGEIWFALIEDPSVARAYRPDYSHLAFSCSKEDFPCLKKRLKDHGCRQWSENESEGASFYFLDPDGHRLEIHVGDLTSRIATAPHNPSDNFSVLI